MDSIEPSSLESSTSTSTSTSSSSSTSTSDNNLNLRNRFKSSKSSSSSESLIDDPKLSAAKASIEANADKDSVFPIHNANLFILTVAILFRLMVGLHSYSGEGVGPVFGDFEAQRHWMEITLHTPIREWYRNTASNDLTYWGLDYPPLSAYWAFITGFVANKINPLWVELIKSRGFESEDLKVFMRLTAIASDLLIMISGAFLLSRKIPNFTKSNLLVALLTPAFLLIDHGHFQYNNVMLGFTLWSLAMFAMQRYCLSVVFLMLSIAFKQMNIYSLPAFGAGLLGIGMSGGTFKSTIISYFKYGLFAVLTLAACFGPFLESKETILPVLHRLFPVNRGLFEEKVANFWCSLAILTKFHRKHSNEQLFRYCLMSVLTVLIPISLGFVVKGMRKGGLGIVAFLRGLSLVCLSMYLFSYHVHEKQILIPLLPITFLLSDSPWFVYFFTSWASFSLFPLMKKDNLQVAYFAVCLAWNCVFFLSNSSRRIGGLWKFLIFISLDFILVNHAVQVFWTPPAKYPDLFLVLNTLSSSGAFGISAVYLFYKFIFVKN